MSQEPNPVKEWKRLEERQWDLPVSVRQSGTETVPVSLLESFQNLPGVKEPSELNDADKAKIVQIRLEGQPERFGLAGLGFGHIGKGRAVNETLSRTGKIAETLIKIEMKQIEAICKRARLQFDARDYPSAGTFEPVGSAAPTAGGLDPTTNDPGSGPSRLGGVQPPGPGGPASQGALEAPQPGSGRTGRLRDSGPWGPDETLDCLGRFLEGLGQTARTPCREANPITIIGQLVRAVATGANRETLHAIVVRLDLSLTGDARLRLGLEYGGEKTGLEYGGDKPGLGDNS